MRIKQHDDIDWNSPGTMFPVRGERPGEASLGDIDLGDDLSPEMMAVTKQPRTGRRTPNCCLRSVSVMDRPRRGSAG